MKKLVKTAKQQFEERLSELQNPVIEKIRDTTYYSCDDQDGHFVVLSKYEGNYEAYCETIYSYPLMDIYTDADFLASLVEYWIEYRNEPLKVLFEWYATADKDNPPFGADDILQCYGKGSHISFGDEYEEIPDTNIITAKEQWEKESANAVLVQTLANGSIYKVENTSEYIDFYIYNNGQYFKERFAPLSELRTDKNFTIDYLNHVYSLHDGDIHLAFEWINGGEYKMSELSLLDICEVAKAKTITEYEDVEVLQEQTIEKKDFSLEFQNLKSKMIEYIEELYGQGMNIDFDWMCNNVHTIGWEDGCYDYMDTMELFELDEITNVFLRFKTDNSGDKYEVALANLSINALWSVICSMR